MTSSRHINKPDDRRRRELASIHIAAKDLGLRSEHDDDAYRSMLYSVARVRSAADLDHAGRRRVLDHLRTLGWRPRKTVAGSSAKRGSPQKMPGRTTPEQLALIRHIWTSLGDAGELRRPGDDGLRRFVVRQTARHQDGQVEAPEFLTRRSAQDIIEHLKRWAARCGVNWKGER